MRMETKTAPTPNDLLLLLRPENGKHYERCEGELIVVGSPAWRHERIKSVTLGMLIVYLERHSIGSVFSDAQFTMASDGARIPNVAFVSRSKLGLLPDQDIAIPFAPGLAIEIIANSKIAARGKEGSGIPRLRRAGSLAHPADRS
jgi:Uma2 family endonuclease